MSLRALGIVVLLLSQKVLAELPAPYNSIVVLPFDDHGWFSNGSQLGECFSERSIKCVIEVGSWLGLSARFLAEQVGPEGKVYCIDNWRGGPFSYSFGSGSLYKTKKSSCKIVSTVFVEYYTCKFDRSHHSDSYGVARSSYWHEYYCRFDLH